VCVWGGGGRGALHCQQGQLFELEQFVLVTLRIALFSLDKISAFSSALALCRGTKGLLLGDEEMSVIELEMMQDMDRNTRVGQRLEGAALASLIVLCVGVGVCVRISA